ncbi:MAG: hypothetical protein IJ746_03555 [Ruminococcus sp.]|nr:hypothetical protein [Ruminococcus sp.]
MNDKDLIPRLVWERDQARLTHTIKIMATIIVIMTVAITAITAAFLCYIRTKDKELFDFISSYDFESYEYDQDGEGVNIVGDSNGVDYYGSESKNTQDKEEGR